MRAHDQFNRSLLNLGDLPGLIRNEGGTRQIPPGKPGGLSLACCQPTAEAVAEQHPQP